MRSVVMEGLDPAVVADRVFEAVRDETHLEHAAGLVWRTQNIVEQRNPDLANATGGAPSPKNEAAS